MALCPAGTTSARAAVTERSAGLAADGTPAPLATAQPDVSVLLTWSFNGKAVAGQLRRSLRSVVTSGWLLALSGGPWSCAGRRVASLQTRCVYRSTQLAQTETSGRPARYGRWGPEEFRRAGPPPPGECCQALADTVQPIIGHDGGFGACAGRRGGCWEACPAWRPALRPADRVRRALRCEVGFGFYSRRLATGLPAPLGAVPSPG